MISYLSAYGKEYPPSPLQVQVTVVPVGLQRLNLDLDQLDHRSAPGFLRGSSGREFTWTAGLMSQCWLSRRVLIGLAQPISTRTSIATAISSLSSEILAAAANVAATDFVKAVRQDVLGNPAGMPEAAPS